MVEHSDIRYILFSYVGHSEEESDFVIAALTLQLHENGSGNLSVYTRPDWEHDQDGEQLDLAKDTLNDWKQIPPVDAPMVFEDLLDASWGPLRVVEDGTCAPAELESILSRKLGASS